MLYWLVAGGLLLRLAAAIFLYHASEIRDLAQVGVVRTTADVGLGIRLRTFHSADRRLNGGPEVVAARGLVLVSPAIPDSCAKDAHELMTRPGNRVAFDEDVTIAEDVTLVVPFFHLVNAHGYDPLARHELGTRIVRATAPQTGDVGLAGHAVRSTHHLPALFLGGDEKLEGDIPHCRRQLELVLAHLMEKKHRRVAITATADQSLGTPLFQSGRFYSIGIEAHHYAHFTLSGLENRFRANSAQPLSSVLPTLEIGRTPITD